MPARWVRRLGVAAAALTLAACATARVENGVFRVPERFRVTVPGPGWEITSAEGTELSLRHRDSHAGIRATAQCGEEAARLDLRALTVRLLLGLHERETLENGPASVGGVPAAHTVVEAQLGRSAERIRVEAYVMKDERCVYDLVYAAHADAFEAQRRDFGRFVESFAKE